MGRGCGNGVVVVVKMQDACASRRGKSHGGDSHKNHALLHNIQLSVVRIPHSSACVRAFCLAERPALPNGIRSDATACCKNNPDVTSFQFFFRFERERLCRRWNKSFTLSV